MSENPKGCFEYIDYEAITRRDIHHNRPCDQYQVSTERALHHNLIVEERKKFWPFRKIGYWVALSTTTYEMSGSFHPRSRFMGGRSWAETDWTGLEWNFHNKADAEEWAYKRSD
jgi:hypothetical protein